MMLALGVARDLGADDSGRVVLIRGAADAPDAHAVDALDLERAGRGAVVRAGAVNEIEGHGLAPNCLRRRI